MSNIVSKVLTNLLTPTAFGHQPIEIDQFRDEPEREGGTNDLESILEEDAKVHAMNAVKYFELTNVRRHNYAFSFAAMLRY